MKVKYRSWNKQDNCYYFFNKGKYLNDAGQSVEESKFNWDNSELSLNLKDKFGIDLYQGDTVRVNIYPNEGMSSFQSYEERMFFTVDELKGSLQISFESVILFEFGEFIVYEGNRGCGHPLYIFYEDQRRNSSIHEIIKTGSKL